MKGFKYRQAYAMLEKRKRDGTLPKNGRYTFVIGLNTVMPRVTGCSLNGAQERVLRGIILMCSPVPEAKQVA